MSRLLTNIVYAGRYWACNIPRSSFSTYSSILANSKSNSTDDLFDSLFKHIPREKARIQQNKTLVSDSILQDVLRNSGPSTVTRQKPSIPAKPISNDVVDIDWSVLGGIDKSKLVRTGVMQSRSFIVRETSGGLTNAMRMLAQTNRSNNIRRTRSAQSRFEKPAKRKRRLRIAKEHRLFDDEIRRLFHLVREAKRKGY